MFGARPSTGLGRVLVLGAGHDLGRAVARAVESPDLRTFAGSLRQHDAVRRAMADAAVVYHCHPLDPRNVDGYFYATALVLEAARAGRPHVVVPVTLWPLAGDGAAHGATVLHGRERKGPRGHLAGELWRMEDMVRSAGEMWDVPYTLVRLPDVVGPGRFLPPFGDLWRDASRGRTVWLDVRPDVERELVHVRDAAAALVAVGGRSEAAAQELLAPGGIVGTARAVAAAVARSAGRRPPRVCRRPRALRALRWIGSRAAREFSPLAPLYERTVRLDGAAIRTFGYEPAVTLEAIARGEAEV